MVEYQQWIGGTVDVEFTVEDIALTRFAISPLWEVVASVRVLKGSDEQGLHKLWTDQVRPRLAAAKLDLTVLWSLIEVPTIGIPGFLVPPPTTPQPSLEIELAALRATPHELLRTTLRGSVAECVAAMRYEPDHTLGRLADEIAAYWEVALAPFWPRIQRLAEDDIMYRARRFVDGGTQLLFADFDPTVSWEESRLRIQHKYVHGTRTLGGRGLLLVPSAFVWPRVFSTLGYEAWQPTLRYPPRGVGQLWSPVPGPLSDALAAVLGRGRAALLAELEAPASTTDLARRLGKTPGGISQHLMALRAAGLVRSHRSGRVVLYARTHVAEKLLEGAGE